MAKSEVYSWRLSIETKSALEETARQQKSSVAELLDHIVTDWLARQQALADNKVEQQRLHNAASRTIGAIQGNDPNRSSNAKALLRAKLAQRRAH